MRFRHIISVLIFVALIFAFAQLIITGFPDESENIDTGSVAETAIAIKEIYESEVEPPVGKTDTRAGIDSVDTATVADSVQQSKKSETVKLVPVLDAAKCISCNRCVKVCPTGAITMIDGKPVIDPEKCIRCWNCIKYCPVDALSLPEDR